MANRFNRSKDYTHVLLSDAQWNFLAPSGAPLFPEPFDFADRFYAQTALVRREGKWGVVNPDSILLPIEYRSVERMPEYRDTVFLVSKSDNGFRYLDSRSNELPLKLSKILKNEEHFAIVQSGSKQFVLNNDYEIVSPEATSIRALNGTYFMVRQNRLSEVYKYDGTLFATIDAKPKTVFFDQLLLCRDGSQYGLVDDAGDTLLPFDYTSISVHGDLILAEGTNSKVLDRDGNTILSLGREKVLIDSVTNQIAVNDFGKIHIYDQNGVKLQKVKGIDPDVFINGVLIGFGNSGTYKVLDGTERKIPTGIRSIEAIGKTGYAITTRKGCSVRGLNWEILSEAGETVYEKYRYLEEGVVQLRKDRKRYFFSAGFGFHAYRGQIRGKFSSGLILSEIVRGKEYEYLTPIGENPFDQKFRDAQPFLGGYATVKMRRGWTIIDANGRAKSLDSYGELTVYGNGLFSTRSAALFGMIDHHGKVILETEYERLSVLNSSVIQAMKDGRFFYFELDGTPIDY